MKQSLTRGPMMPAIKKIKRQVKKHNQMNSESITNYQNQRISIFSLSTYINVYLLINVKGKTQNGI